MWESWIVCKVAVEHGIDFHGFRDKKTARFAMNAANEALLRGDRKPEPKWAAQARAAGWTAPEELKP
jgi:hypothetical protein